MEKRVASLLLALVLLFGILPLSACGDNGDRVTRGEWIELITTAFGMDSYANEEPCYTDITPETPLFPRVQAAAGWGLLLAFDGDVLEPDKRITREEAAISAAIAAGFAVSEDQFDAAGRFDSAAAIRFAVENGMLENDRRLSRALTQEEAQVMLEAAKTAYLNAPFEEKMNVVFAENVVTLDDVDADRVEVSDGQVILPGSVSATTAMVETRDGTAELQVGDIFFTPPSADAPAGEPRKIISIDQQDGQLVIRTSTPSFEEVFETIDLYTSVQVQPENIIWAPGIEPTGSGASGLSGRAGENYTVNLSDGMLSEASVITLDEHAFTKDGFSKDFVFGDKSFNVQRSNHNSSAIGSGEGARALENSSFFYDGTPSIADFNGLRDAWTRDLQIDSGFSGGYKITGNITLEDIVVTVKYETKWLKLKEASIQIDSGISSSLKFEGSLKNDLKIATIPIPIFWGVNVTADLYLYVDAAGELNVRAALGGSAKVEYKDKQIRSVAEPRSELSVDGNMKIDFGADLSAALDVAIIGPVIDAGIKVGGELEASAQVSGSCKATADGDTTRLEYQESLSISADLYYPIMSVYACSARTAIAKLGIRDKTWNIKTRDNATHKTLANFEWVFWEETVIEEEDGTVTEGEPSTAGGVDGIGPSDERVLDLQQYVVTLQGQAVQLVAEFPQGTPLELVWRSENPSVATVDQNGVVSPVSTGETQITVSLASDPDTYVKCAIYVAEIGEENWEFLSARPDTRQRFALERTAINEVKA